MTLLKVCNVHTASPFTAVLPFSFCQSLLTMQLEDYAHDFSIYMYWNKCIGKHIVSPGLAHRWLVSSSLPKPPAAAPSDFMLPSSTAHLSATGHSAVGLRVSGTRQSDFADWLITISSLQPQCKKMASANYSP